MQFGIVVPSSFDVDSIIDAAKKADENELDYFLVTDHYMTPNYNSSADAWSVLSAVAAVTKKIKIGSCVSPIPFRPPAQLAKIVATVDQIFTRESNSRRWERMEQMQNFLLHSWDEDGKIRARKAREGLDLILALWDKKKTQVDFSGKYLFFSGGSIGTKACAGPHVPLWFGTEGEYTLKVTARIGQGWVPKVPGVSLEGYRRVISIIRDEERKIGRKERVKISCNGTISELGSNLLEQYVKIGCEVALLAKTKEKYLVEEILTLATKIIPSFNS